MPSIGGSPLYRPTSNYDFTAGFSSAYDTAVARRQATQDRKRALAQQAQQIRQQDEAFQVELERAERQAAIDNLEIRRLESEQSARDELVDRLAGGEQPLPEPAASAQASSDVFWSHIREMSGAGEDAAMAAQVEAMRQVVPRLRSPEDRQRLLGMGYQAMREQAEARERQALLDGIGERVARRTPYQATPEGDIPEDVQQALQGISEQLATGALTVEEAVAAERQVRMDLSGRRSRARVKTRTVAMAEKFSETVAPSLLPLYDLALSLYEGDELDGDEFLDQVFRLAKGDFEGIMGGAAGAGQTGPVGAPAAGAANGRIASLPSSAPAAARSWEDIPQEEQEAFVTETLLPLVKADATDEEVDAAIAEAGIDGGSIPDQVVQDMQRFSKAKLEGQLRGAEVRLRTLEQELEKAPKRTLASTAAAERGNTALRTLQGSNRPAPHTQRYSKDVEKDIRELKERIEELKERLEGLGSS